jgi:ABC-2 type transport system permease protein
MLVGHVVAGMVRNLVSTAIVLGLAFALGFRPHAGAAEWLAALALLLLVIWAISWVSVCFGLIARSPEAASGFSFFILFLPYVSSAFVPTSTMPSGLQAVADHQPITPVIETLRGLLTGSTIGSSGTVAVIWFGAISALAMATATVLFRRRTSS